MTNAYVAPAVVADVRRSQPRERVRRAARIVVVGLAIGALAQLLFYGTGIGLNVVLMVAAVLVAAWRLRPAGSRLARADAWLAPSAAVLALFAGLRGDIALAVIDTLAALALMGLAIIASSGTPVTSRPVDEIAMRAARLLGGAMVAAPLAAADARAGLPGSGAVGGRLRAVLPILRGLLLALPVVLVVTALFASADAVFARAVADAFDLRIDVEDLPGRVLVALVVGWLATGALAATVGSAPGDAPRIAAPPRLGATEAITVLVALVVVFAIFVALQAAYLFGGLDTLEYTGLTYAEYARRGFFELCAVAFVVGAIVLAMEATVDRRRRAYVVLASLIVALTGAVIASSALRLGLYQQAYGWTELRFYVAASIAWLGIGVALTLVAVALDRSRWLPHGLLVAALVVGLAVNLIGPVRLIATENVARAVDPSLVAPGGRTGLDTYYLLGLGADAVEPILRALPDLPEAERASAALLLSRWRSELREPDPWQAWNLGRARARELLAVPPD